MTTLTESRIVWKIAYEAKVEDAPPVELPRQLPRDRIKRIDPRYVHVEWITKPNSQFLRVSITGKVINMDGAVGLRTDTREWFLNRNSPPTRLPAFVGDIIDDQIEANQLPPWGVALWKHLDQ